MWFGPVEPPEQRAGLVEQWLAANNVETYGYLDAAK
jgi:hypothetical protein